jgi:hypothetical protein
LRGQLVPDSWDRLWRAFEIAWGFAKPRGPMFDPHSLTAEVVRQAALLEWVVLAGAGALLVIARVRGRIAGSPFATLAILLVAVDLFKVGMGFNPAVPVSRAAQPSTGAIEYLQSRRPNRFVGVQPAADPFSPLPPNVSMNYGLYDARGYDFVVERRYDHLWASTVGSTADEHLPTYAPVNPKSLRTLSLLSVADLVQEPAAPPAAGPGLRLAYEGVDAKVYANDRALPRVLLVDRQQLVTDGEHAMAAVTAPGFDGSRVAVTEEPLPGLRRADGGSPRPAGQARLTTYEPERVIARTSSLRPALLVLTDDHFPGWRATVDGRPAALYRVDYLLRGVAVPRGTHTVEFRYRPDSFTAGAIVSALALLVLVALAVVGMRRRPAHPTPNSRSGAA